MKKTHISNCTHDFWKFNIMYPRCLVVVYYDLHYLFIWKIFRLFIWRLEELKKKWCVIVDTIDCYDIFLQAKYILKRGLYFIPILPAGFHPLIGNAFKKKLCRNRKSSGDSTKREMSTFIIALWWLNEPVQ